MHRYSESLLRQTTCGILLTATVATWLVTSAMGNRAVQANEREGTPQERAPESDQEGTGNREAGEKLKFRVIHTMEEWGGRALELHTVTILGRAKDHLGAPVAGATICVASTNSTRPSDLDPVLAKTTTRPDGSFEFRDIKLPVIRRRPDPLPKPPEGDFIVFGWADGFGFTWHFERSYRPERRPDGIDPADVDAERTNQAFYAGERIEADLLFEPPAKLHGRILDDQEQPLANVKVQVGHCDNVRNPLGYGSRFCSHIGPADEQVGNHGRFDAIGYLPAQLREARTDENGYYELNGLRRDTQYSLLIDPGLEFDPYSTRIVTMDGQSPNRYTQYVGYDAELSPTFQAPRDVDVHVTCSDTSRPAPEVIVRAHGSKYRRAGALAATNSDGKAILRLPPGSYTLYVEPPADAGYVFREEKIEVVGEPKRQSVEAGIDPAAVVVLRAVEAKNGSPVAGVSFFYETDTSRQQRHVQSQTVFVDHPTTNARGELRAVMFPGRRRFIIDGYPTEFDPVEREGELVDLTPQEVKTVCFEFERKSEAADATAMTGGSPYPADLVAKWQKQRRLQARVKARLKLRRHHQPHDLSFEGLTEVFKFLDPDRVPDLTALFRDTFNEPFLFAEKRITVDGAKRRNDTRYLHHSLQHEVTDILLFNGAEGVQYSAINAQADVHGRKNFRIHVTGISDLCYWPHASTSRSTKPAQPGETPKPTVTRSGGKVFIEMEQGSSSVRITADETSGFVFHYSYHLKTARNYARAWWQFAPKTYRNGVVLPGLSIEARGRDGHVDTISAHIIESAEFLDELPPDSFSVSLPAGVNVLDYRNVPDDGPRRPRGGVVRGPITDVVAYVNRRSPSTRSVEPVLKYGQRAPAIEPAKWLNQAGETAPPDLSGKVVLIEFWEIGCGPCVAQLPEVRAAAKHYANSDLVLIGLHGSRTTVERLTSFAKENQLAYQLAIDREAIESGWFGATMQAFGVRGIPSAAVINRQGRLVYLGDLRQALKRVDGLLKAN